MKLNNSICMLFALLRCSLQGGTVDVNKFAQSTDADWNLCYDTAAKQGVLALAWEGVQKLPVELQPPKQLKFKWALNVEKYEVKHRKYCLTVQDLQQFYARNGIVAVQMKGVGLSATYNKPAHREGGDIDIYTYSADVNVMSHREANLLADELMCKKGIEVDYSHSEKHSNFYFKGIPIENHQWFVNIELNPKFLNKLNGLLINLLNPQGVSLLEGECSILTPSPQFNMVFLAYHTFQHFGSGIALHHLYDWANLINKYGLALPDSITETSFLRATAALTHLSNTYLGTNINLQGFPQGYEELADRMLQEMLYPKYKSQVPYKNPLMIVWYKFIRVLYSNSLRAKTLQASPLYLLLHSIIWHLRYPATILNRGEK